MLRPRQAPHHDHCVSVDRIVSRGRVPAVTRAQYPLIRFEK
jgi:hypothetical protein